MADTTQSPTPLGARVARIDKVWAAVVAIHLAVAVLDPPEFVPTVEFAGNALLGTLPFILFAVLAIGYLKATGAENLLSNAFEGRETRMIILAALLGGLSPFCSCEVIPFIAALLAIGAPLSAVMAFWLASPLMDPAMFGITAGALGFEFAMAKLAFAVSLGLLGGFGTKLMKSTAVFHNPLREKPQVGGCCGVKKPFADKPNWKFWQEPARREAFRDAASENGLFLLKWLSFAYVIEALMVTYMPAQLIANVLGGDGFQPIFLGALVGMPAYLNGYAAPALVAGLLEQGMANGAAMSFVIAGGVSSIPAAIAVWALVKPHVFAAYIGFALLGALLAGSAWQAIA